MSNTTLRVCGVADAGRGTRSCPSGLVDAGYRHLAASHDTAREVTSSRQAVDVNAQETGCEEEDGASTVRFGIVPVLSCAMPVSFSDTVRASAVRIGGSADFNLEVSVDRARNPERRQVQRTTDHEPTLR